MNRIRLVGATAALGAGLVALLLFLAYGGGGPQPVPAGLPDPGPLTGWALPIAGYAGTALGVLVVGSLLVAPLTGDRPGAELADRAVLAVRLVRGLALAWVVVVLAELVLTYSDQFAVPVTEVRWDELSGFARQVDQGRALVVQAALALVVALLSRWVLTIREAMLLLAPAVLAQLPPVLTGHSASSGSHDTAIISLLLHVAAAALWTGGLVALWWAPDDPRPARRFGALATWCLGVVLASGTVNALVRLGSPDALLTSDYGRGVLAKLLVLAGVVLVAARVRRAALARRSLLVLTAGELTLMGVAVGLGVALGRTPPPVGEPYTSAAESLLGGPVPPAPTAWRLLTSVTPSGVALAALGLGATAYLVGVHVVRRRGGRWSRARTLSWCVGVVTVAYATGGGLGTYSHVLFSAHMGSHMVLSMVAPVFLVLGAPVTLALRALPGSDVPGGAGPRQWLAGALRSRPARVLTHPVTVAVLSVGSLYAVYLTDLFDVLMRSHLGHAAMELHFLASGCLLFEVLVGDAPVRRIGHLARLGLLLVVMPFHAFFAVALMASDTVLAADYYARLDRGYATDLLADQYLGASLTWALGEVPMVLVLVVLLAQWYRDDSRQARRQDRHADRTEDAELAAYNAVFAARAGRTDRSDEA